ncbi:MAG: VWA domain-containing protein [Acidobacteriota bacterium]
MRPVRQTWILLVAVLLLVSAPEVAGQASSAQPTFKTGIDLVTFGVTVTDRRGNLVTDLSREDFEIVEDSRPQPLQFFTKGLGGEDDVAAHLGLMLDTSGSMEADLNLARSAAIKFLNLVPEAEDVTLVDFDTEVRVMRYPQRDFPRLVERIRQRKSDGWTALYDALAVYLHGADDQIGRTILVMYTDGADSRSRLSFGDIMELLRASQVTVYAVGLVDHTGSARYGLRMRLQQLVEATGGQAFFPSALKDLDASYDKVLAEIRAQYQLGYLSTNLTQDGTWRRVDIKLKRPGLKVRARKGYFAPYRAPH